MSLAIEELEYFFKQSHCTACLALFQHIGNVVAHGNAPMLLDKLFAKVVFFHNFREFGNQPTLRVVVPVVEQVGLVFDIFVSSDNLGFTLYLGKCLDNFAVVACVELVAVKFLPRIIVVFCYGCKYMVLF